jgi:hypothetical protein
MLGGHKFKDDLEVYTITMRSLITTGDRSPHPALKVIASIVAQAVSRSNRMTIKLNKNCSYYS